MKRNVIKYLKQLLLILVMTTLCLQFTACGQNPTTDTLVIGNGQMTGVFSPFFSETADDALIVQLTSMTLLRPDESGELTGYASNMDEPEHILNEDGSVKNTIYRFRLKEGLKFSDGEPVTADDIIFSIKVLCDPTYNGLSLVGSLPIVGLNAYKYDTEDYEEVINGLLEEASNVSSEYVDAYIKQMAEQACFEFTNEEIASYLGIELDPSLSDEEITEFLINSYYEFEKENYYDLYLDEARQAYFEELQEGYLSDQEDGIDVKEISGVKKLDEATVEITIEGINPSAIWELGEMVIAPEHYYCSEFEDGNLVKGQLDKIRELNETPVGAGPYIFEQYENNVVSLKANEFYPLGKPTTEYIKVTSTNNINTIDAVIRSEIDIAEVPATEEVMERASSEGLGVITTDFEGYGYIGVNSANITDKYVRKGILSLMNREPAINAYFGKLARIIERPVSGSSWVYPEDAKPFYEYDPDQALEYFKQAGYEQREVDGKKILAREGSPLKLIAGVGGEGTMDHPAALVFAQMKNDLDKIGAELEIIDCDLSVLVDGLYQGSWDLWAASWELGYEPSLENRYMTSGEGNYYRLSNKELDDILQRANSTADLTSRKDLYQQAMDIIMDEAIELPLYQRQNLQVYNPEVIDSDSIPEKITAYYGLIEEIHNIQLVK